MKMEIVWQIDGEGLRYVTAIDDSEIKECKSVDGAMRLIDEAIEGDFFNHVSWDLWNEERLRSEIKGMLKAEGSFENER